MRNECIVIIHNLHFFRFRENSTPEKLTSCSIYYFFVTCPAPPPLPICYAEFCHRQYAASSADYYHYNNNYYVPHHFVHHFRRFVLWPLMAAAFLFIFLLLSWTCLMFLFFKISDFDFKSPTLVPFPFTLIFPPETDEPFLNFDLNLDGPHPPLALAPGADEAKSTVSSLSMPVKGVSILCLSRQSL